MRRPFGGAVGGDIAGVCKGEQSVWGVSSRCCRG